MLKDIINETKKCIDVEDYYNAEKSLKKLREDNGDNIEFDIIEIKLLVGKHDYNRALLLIEKVLKSCEANVEILKVKGIIQISKGQKELAYSTLKRAMELDKNDKDILFHLGIASINTGRYEEAREIYREIFHYSKGDEITGYFQSSNKFIIEKYEKKIDILTDDEKAMYGSSEYYLSNFEKAIEIFTSIKDLNINDKVLIILANINRINHKYKKALIYVDKAININDSERAYYNKGLILQEINRVNEAIECYKNVVRINPNYLPVYNKLYELLLRTKKYDSNLESLLEEFIDKKYDYEISLRNMGLFFELQGDSDKAIDYYDKSIRYFNRYVDGYLSKIFIYRNKNDYFTAFEVCERAFEETYQDINVVLVKALLLCDIGQYSNALEWIDWVIDEDEENCKPYYFRSLCLYKLEEYSDALESIDKAININREEILNWSMKIFLEKKINKNGYLELVKEYYDEDKLSKLLIDRFIEELKDSVSSLKVDDTYLNTINILLNQRIGV